VTKLVITHYTNLVIMFSSGLEYRYITMYNDT